MERDYIEIDIGLERLETLLSMLVTFNEKVLNKKTTIVNGKYIMHNDLATDILMQFFRHKGFLYDVQVEFLKEVQEGTITDLEGNQIEKVS